MRPYRCTVLLLYCVALLVACTYVPWKADLRGVQVPLGYAYLWQPPTQQSTGQSMAAFASVDMARLSVTFLAVSAAGGIFLLLGELAPLGLRVVERLRRLTNIRALFVSSWFLLTLILWLSSSNEETAKVREIEHQKTIAHCLTLHERWNICRDHAYENCRTLEGFLGGDPYLFQMFHACGKGESR